MGKRGRPRHGGPSTIGRGHGARRAGTQEPSDADGAPGGRPATGGRAERRRQARRIKRRRQRSYLKEIPILIGVALAIALVLKTFLVQAFVIPSGSMEQTIKIGDRVLVDKLTPWFGSKPERGDVVVFKDPGGWLPPAEKKKFGDDPPGVKQFKEFMTFIGLLPSADEQDLIKRVIGVGGDTVKCCDKQGRITVNGTPLTEAYVHPGNPPSQLKFTVTVPTGRIFVMGDHRSDSADSRFHLDEPYRGTVSEENVVGSAAWIAWPLSHWRRLEENDTFATVRDAPGAKPSAAAAPHRVSPETLAVLPTPAELPLVMGVVGLHRLTGRRKRGVRSRCGGLGGRRAVRNRRARGAGGAG
ncbi:signal peptidase I [Streptomyces piniterrae]|uniref:Signal peptidase I n=1 Tax=Streptomyces piniterrae TaxID=2571125 RepID=A0A4U0MZ74_9ACTN|nr:signal peptidase I [Streptomyces piniterrae]TJZ46226.1 signal peptidase I [Streptomyces piniterrae]